MGGSSRPQHSEPLPRLLPAALLMAALLPAAIACTVSATAARAADDDGLPSPPRLPELVRAKHPVFTIPFRLPAAQQPDAAARSVSLSVSKDLGATWEPAGEVAPSAGSFTYRAGADGEYWFRLRAVDAKGRTRGGEGPDVRVLVDAAGPKLAARVWKGADGEIVCRYAALDDSLRLESLSLEYRGKGDQGWKTVATQGILSRESPAHLVGEEIWWAGEQVDTLTVRIAIADSAGNRTVRQFTLEAADPQVDQAGLAKELGAPSLPTREMAMTGGGLPPMHAPMHAFPPAMRQADPAATAMGRPSSRATPAWAAEPAANWPAEHPPTAADDPTTAAAHGSVLVRRVGSGDLADLPEQLARSAAGTRRPGEAAAARAGGAALTLPATGAGTDIFGTPGRQLEYRGRPLQLVRSRRFAWDYEVPAERTGAGPVRAELWSTRDGGITWQRTAADPDGQSPIDVALPAPGLYGFRLEIVADLPESGGGPRSGDTPDSWVGIDDELPQVELIEVARASGDDSGALVIRYAARDQLLVSRSVRLSFSPNAAGPWATIAQSLEAQGEHRWQPDRSVPARVFVQVEAVDAAGNIGTAVTAEPVVITTSRVVGKLGGLRVLPSAAPAAP